MNSCEHLPFCYLFRILRNLFWVFLKKIPGGFKLFGPQHCVANSNILLSCAVWPIELMNYTATYVFYKILHALLTDLLFEALVVDSSVPLCTCQRDA